MVTRCDRAIALGYQGDWGMQAHEPECSFLLFPTCSKQALGLGAVQSIRHEKIHADVVNVGYVCNMEGSVQIW